MNVKEFLNEHKIEIGFIIGSALGGIATASGLYKLGRYIGAKKGIMAVRDPLMSYLNKDDYVKFCDHYDNFHNIKRG